MLVRKAIPVICILVLAVALFSIWTRFRPYQPQVNRPLIFGVNVGIGEVLAQETVKAVHDRGHIVPVLNYDPDSRDRPPDYRWDSFCAEMKKHSAIHLEPAEVIEHDPHEDQAIGCPTVAFEGLLQRHPDADAFVFFIDLPLWGRVSSSIPTSATVKLIAVDTMGVPNKRHYDGYFSTGILAALIGASVQPPAAGLANPTTPAEWFAKFKEVYTPQNYSSLPD
jgi:hypothetical protein